MAQTTAFRVAKYSGLAALVLLVVSLGGYALAYFTFMRKFEGDDNPYFGWFLFFASIFLAAMIAALVSAVATLVGFYRRRNNTT